MNTHAGAADGAAMRVIETRIPEVKLIYLKPWPDPRGLFVETFNRRDFAGLGLDLDFVQDSTSISKARGTVRGLHFQAPPRAQHRLVRAARGRIFDVVVDLRRGSPSFGAHVSVVLDAANWCHLMVPIGFAHGFCTLEPDTEVVYKMTDYYAAEHQAGLAWDDPDLGIDWPVGREDAILSRRDRQWPRLRELGAPFAGPLPGKAS